MPPLVSVILPVYNGLPYLEQAIDSVLSQSFGDFELIIIDDGSTDGSAALVASKHDARIRFFQQPNMGLAKTLNVAISHARGEFIARQDQDDVCFPLRFQRQIEFLDAHPGIGMVGTAAEIWEGEQRSDRKLAHPCEDGLIKFGMLFGNYFVHSSMMVRRKVFEEVGGYAEAADRQPPEDYELWSRVIKKYKVGNLPEVLMAYREVPNSMSRSGVNPFLANLMKISAENIAWFSGYPVDAQEVVALSKLAQGVYEDIPRTISLVRLEQVLDAAIRGIAQDTGATGGQMAQARRARVKRLRYQYWNCRTGGLIGKVFGNRLFAHLKALLTKSARQAS